MLRQHISKVEAPQRVKHHKGKADRSTNKEDSFSSLDKNPMEIKDSSSQEIINRDKDNYNNNYANTSSRPRVQSIIVDNRKQSKNERKNKRRKIRDTIV